MKDIAIVSRYPHSPHFQVEGHAYSNKREADKMIKVFKARTEALNQVQKKFGIDMSVSTDKQYVVAEILVPDIFFKD